MGNSVQYSYVLIATYSAQVLCYKVGVVRSGSIYS